MKKILLLLVSVCAFALYTAHAQYFIRNSEAEFTFNNADDLSGQWMNGDCVTDGASVALMPRDGAFYFAWPKTSADPTWYWATDLKLPKTGDWVANYGADAGIQFDINTTNGDTIQIQTEIDNVAGTKFGGFATTVNAIPNTWQTVTFYYKDLSLSNWTGNSDVLALTDSPNVVKFSVNTGSYPNDVPMNVMIDNVKLVNATTGASEMEFSFDNAEDLSGQWMNGDCVTDGASVSLMPHDGAFYFAWPKTSADPTWYWATDLKLPKTGDWVANYGADAGIQFDINTTNGDTVQIQTEIDNVAGTKFGGFAITVNAIPNTWQTVTFYYKDLSLSNWTGNSDVLSLTDSPNVVKFSVNTGSYPNDVPMNVMIDNVKLVNATTGASEMEFSFDNADDLSGQWMNGDCVTDGASVSLMPRDGAFYFAWPKTSADPTWYWATDLKLPKTGDWVANYGASAGIQFDVNTTNGDTIQIQTEIDNVAGTKFGGFAKTVNAIPNTWQTVAFRYADLTLANWTGNSDVLALTDSPNVVKFSVNTGSYPNDVPMNVMIDNVNLINAAPVGINSPAISASSLVIYPNPVSNAEEYIHLKGVNGASVNYTIVNTLGQVALRSVLDGSSINVSSLGSGLYILKFDNGQYSTFVKR